jgi:hypothetical protein
MSLVSDQTQNKAKFFISKLQKYTSGSPQLVVLINRKQASELDRAEHTVRHSISGWKMIGEKRETEKRTLQQKDGPYKQWQRDKFPASQCGLTTNLLF